MFFKKNNIIFVTYASGIYKKNIKWNKIFVDFFIRPKLSLFYTDDDLKKDNLYKNNKNIFDAKVGSGYWAWKPWAISQAIQLANEGDVVIYQDCGKGLKYKNFIFPRYLIEYSRSHNIMPGVLVPEHGTNQEWTHKSCFLQMDSHQSQYFHTPQVEAVISAWLVNQQSKDILESWQNYCLNEKVISDRYINSTEGFATKGHRYDQSVLTNLVIKNKLQPIKPIFIGLHMFKSMSLLEIYLRRTKFISKLVFALLHRLVLFKRILFKYIRLK